MKFNNNLTLIKVGRIYHWDAADMLTTIHKETKTVKVLHIYNRKNASPLAEVQSIETNEIFQADIAYFQLNPNYLKIKYNKLLRYYKKNKPNMIFKYTSIISGVTYKYIIIGNLLEVNCLLALDKEGIISSFDYSWFEKLNLKRNTSFDREQESMMEEYYQDFCDDFD